MIANTPESRNAFLRLCPEIDSKRVSVIPNGYDREDFGEFTNCRRSQERPLNWFMSEPSILAEHSPHTVCWAGYAVYGTFVPSRSRRLGARSSISFGP